MRYARIFLLTLQQVFEQRARSFVWFLVSLWIPLVTLLFWRGATNSGRISIAGWDYRYIVSYYFLLIIAGALLSSNIEEDVARYDIQLGNLTKYLVRPISYLRIKFLEEVPYRILKGVYGAIIILIFFLLLRGQFIQISRNAGAISFAIVIITSAIIISYLFKMILGLLAFWIIEIRGIYELVDVCMLVFAGNIMPINFFPNWLAITSYVLPFSYMIYFPILAIEGRLTFFQTILVIGMDIIWIGLFYSLYLILWSKGIKKFSGIGQ